MIQAPGVKLTVGGQAEALPRDRRSAGVPVIGYSGIQVNRSPSHPLTLSPAHPPTPGLVIERRVGKWMFAGVTDTIKQAGKRPGLQGPIDDAFTSRFLCVRGTGTPWTPTTRAWVYANP